MTDKAQTSGDPEQGSPYPSDAILAALASAPLSIDVVAERLGARSVREVRNLGLALRALAEAGRVAAVGNGAWCIPGAEPAAPVPVDPADILLHGFGDGEIPVPYARLCENVASATGREPVRLHEALSTLVASGKVTPVGQRSYLLTDGTQGVLQEAQARTGERIGPAGARALGLMAQPVSQIQLAGMMGVTRERARQLIFRLLEQDLAEAVDAGPERPDAKRLYRAAAARVRAA